MLFLGTFVPTSKIPEYKGISSYIDYPGIYFQDTLHYGFCSVCEKVSSIVVPNLKTFFPNSYIGSYTFDWHGSPNNLSMGYFNIHGVKELVTPYKILSNIKEPIDMVFIYSIGSLQYKVASLLKRKYPQVKIISIIADLPEYMSMSTSPIVQVLKKIDWKIIKYNIQAISGFVFLSPYMKEKLPIGDKPWIQVEGIFNAKDENIQEASEKGNYIFYSGALYEKYGVNDLVNAFNLIQDTNVELWLCGYGESESFIKKSQKQNPRIKFLGILDRDKVLDLQKNARLLINPRHSTEEFTRYSFPSKTMEYLVSGTPVLMSRLACIPSNYDDYLFYFDDESVEGFAKKIDEVLRMDSTQLNSIGRLARKFILTKKNPIVQCQRIVDFVENIRL